jgi:hypothetical protein
MSNLSGGFSLPGQGSFFVTLDRFDGRCGKRVLSRVSARMVPIYSRTHFAFLTGSFFLRAFVMSGPEFR